MIGWGLLTLQPSQPLLRILYFSNTRVSVFPEVEEFLIMLYGLPSSFLLDLLFISQAASSSAAPNHCNGDRRVRNRSCHLS